MNMFKSVSIIVLLIGVGCFSGYGLYAQDTGTEGAGKESSVQVSSGDDSVDSSYGAGLKVLVFLVVATVLLIFIDAGTISFKVQDKWTDLLQLVLITVIGAYFGGRSLEKVKK